MAILYLYRIVTFKAVLLKFADAVASTELVIHFVSTYIYAAVRVLYNVSFRIPSALCVLCRFLQPCIIVPKYLKQILCCTVTEHSFTSY